METKLQNSECKINQNSNFLVLTNQLRTNQNLKRRLWVKMRMESQASRKKMSQGFSALWAQTIISLKTRRILSRTLARASSTKIPLARDYFQEIAWLKKKNRAVYLASHLPLETIIFLAQSKVCLEIRPHSQRYTSSKIVKIRKRKRRRRWTK